MVSPGAAGDEVPCALRRWFVVILWSSTATLAFAWTALTTGPRVGWILVVIFALFGVLWTSWRCRLGRTTP